MKIRKLTSENYIKVAALLKQAFPDRAYETRLVEKLHKNGRTLHEWVCLHTNNKVIAYIAFSNAYKGAEICGLHLAPLAVKPAFQKQGVGSELLRFALRQEAVSDRPIYVLGEPGFFRKFGFQPCADPVCPFDKSNRRFLAIRNPLDCRFTVGYEPEF